MTDNSKRAGAAFEAHHRFLFMARIDTQEIPAESPGARKGTTVNENGTDLPRHPVGLQPTDVFRGEGQDLGPPRALRTIMRRKCTAAPVIPAKAGIYVSPGHRPSPV